MCKHEWQTVVDGMKRVALFECVICGERTVDFCRVCGTAIDSAELCDDCADGNNPFQTAGNCGADLKR